MKNNLKYLFPLVAGFSGTVMAQSTTANLPNVVYIMADDLGIGDLGCYGQRQIKTVNIDGIAQNGMKFMQHYSGATVSAPSRCALLTGKHMGYAAPHFLRKKRRLQMYLKAEVMQQGVLVNGDWEVQEQKVCPISTLLIIFMVTWDNVLLIVIIRSFCMKTMKKSC